LFTLGWNLDKNEANFAFAECDLWEDKDLKRILGNLKSLKVNLLTFKLFSLHIKVVIFEEE